jgi:hypothetical protein
MFWYDGSTSSVTPSEDGSYKVMRVGRYWRAFFNRGSDVKTYVIFNDDRYDTGEIDRFSTRELAKEACLADSVQ